jgi:hypothetical protein
MGWTPPFFSTTNNIDGNIVGGDILEWINEQMGNNNWQRIHDVQWDDHEEMQDPADLVSRLVNRHSKWCHTSRVCLFDKAGYFSDYFERAEFVEDVIT